VKKKKDWYFKIFILARTKVQPTVAYDTLRFYW